MAQFLQRKEDLHDTMNLITEGSFEEVYEKYWSEMYIFAYNIIRDRDGAKDLIQEVFITLLQRKQKEEIENIRAFLYQSVKYQIYHLIRHENVRLKTFQQSGYSDYDNATTELLEVKELQKQIDQSISSLPEKCRMVFQLKQEGHTAKAIALSTGLSKRTVEHQIYIAVKKLRYTLGNLITLLIISLSLLLP